MAVETGTVPPPSLQYYAAPPHLTTRCPLSILPGYLAQCRELVVDEISSLFPGEGRYGPILYKLMLEYPLREAKGLRPALCMAVCRAAGGKLESVLRTSAILELYHNAFLVHDDIEDASRLRRGAPTLHMEHGVAVAINVGDAMLAMTLEPLLDNVAVLGLGPALRVLEAIGRMSRETVEGQALELDWIRQQTWDITDEDYIELVVKKTSWYSFITPVVVGAIAAGVGLDEQGRFSEFARALGIAFQIQDDVLNLAGAERVYGKEISGDLWEGKRTLALLHMMRCASPDERSEAERILGLPRPEALGPAAEVVDALYASGSLPADGRARLLAALGAPTGECKQPAEVHWLLDRITHHGSVEYARSVASGWVAKAEQKLERALHGAPRSVHAEFLHELVAYCAERSR